MAIKVRGPLKIAKSNHRAFFALTFAYRLDRAHLCDNSWRRRTAALGVAYGAGLRVSDVVSLKVSAIGPLNRLFGSFDMPTYCIVTLC
jgi:site-specific recombinase XerD